MNRRITITFFCILAAATRLASGQNDPFETNVPSPEKRAGSAAAKGLARPLEVGEETDAAILSLRRSNPKTPEQLIEAVRVVFDLGRFDEASNYIDRLLELNLDDATLAALRSRPGSDFFLRIANQESLTAARREFGVRVLDASARVTRDADRLSALVPKLSDASLQVRAAAGSELILAGRSAIPPLVTVLADAARSNEHPAIRQLLVRLGKDAVEPLVGTLQSDDPQLKAQVIRVLGKLNATRCVSYFLAPAILPDANAELQSSARDALARTVRELPSRDDACRFLARRIQAHLGGESPVAVGSDGTGELWDWDATARRPVPWMLDARVLNVVEASRLARELALLAPDDQQHKRLALATRLEAAQLIAGLDNPPSMGDPSVVQFASQAGMALLNDALTDCLRNRRSVGAMAIIHLLGSIADPSLLETFDGRPATLTTCLQHPDRRVRFAAAMAILRIDPPSAFAGSSMLTDCLSYLSSTVGMRRVIVVHPRPNDAQSLVGMLNQRGFEAESAPTGRAGFQLAVKNPDCEFLLLSEVVEQPRTFEMLQMLRHEPRTAHLPVCIISRAEDVEKLRRESQLDEFTFVFVRPYEMDSLDQIIDRSLLIAARQNVGRDQRVEQARQCLEWIARMNEAENRYEFYDLPRVQPAVETALQTGELSSLAARILGQFGSPRSQQALMEFASEAHWPVGDRREAVKAFAAAVQKRSILLTRDAIMTQYRRYNGSARLDQQSQQVLSDILDILEQPPP